MEPPPPSSPPSSKSRWSKVRLHGLGLSTAAVAPKCHVDDTPRTLFVHIGGATNVSGSALKRARAAMGPASGGSGGRMARGLHSLMELARADALDTYVKVFWLGSLVGRTETARAETHPVWNRVFEVRRDERRGA
jgi:hypothetical protein